MPMLTPVDLMSRLVRPGQAFGHVLDVLRAGEFASNVAKVQNCSQTYGCCERTTINETAMVLTHCDEGPDYFRAESYIHGINGFSEYWAPLVALVSTGLGWSAQAALDKLFASWLHSSHWIPPTIGGAFPPPANDEASATTPSDISPDELRANQQYDAARELAAWRKPDLPQADADIARALIVHLANTPRASDMDSWHVIALCGLLAHGLDFQLSQADAQNLRIIPGMPSLIRRDDMFVLLHDVLVPEWETDDEGAPTFSVHPVDVQLFDPDETTDDLGEDPRGTPFRSSPETIARRKREIREWRERITEVGATERVCSRVVSLIAASVRNDCGVRTDWRYLFNMQMSIASVYLETCADVLERIGNSVMADVSPRDIWKWHDAAPIDTHGPRLPSMPMPVAQWLARVLIIEAGVQTTPTVHSAFGFAAMARMDTPPALVIGSPAWSELVKGVEVMGNAHWRVSFDTVSRAGRTGENPVPDASKPDAPEREASARWQKPTRNRTARRKHGHANWRHG